MKAYARNWLRRNAKPFLRRVGLTEGQIVLDFGCHEGNYAIPAARIVGPAARVYAVDKNQEQINDLRRRIAGMRVHNIEILLVSPGRRIPLPCASVDVVLLYDTLHRGYFPKPGQRRGVLRRIYRVLKPGGLLSCYPTHLRRYGMTFRKLLEEIRSVGFALDDQHRRILVHDGKLVRGAVFSFRMPPAAVLPSPQSRRTRRA